LQPLTFNTAIIPFVTGTVGYVTNWLAIKMLFRPHRPKWYTFGWQGVIPRKRAKLAQEVGVLVGTKLISEHDIVGALGRDDVRLALAESVEKELTSFLQKDYGTIEEILTKFGIEKTTLAAKLTEYLEENTAIADAIAGFIKPYLNITLRDLEKDKNIIKELTSKLFDGTDFADSITGEIDAGINNFILSGKSMGDILPRSVVSQIPALSEKTGTKLVNMLDSLLSSDTARTAFVSKLIDFKNTYFENSGMDMLKQGMLNMFLTDEKIADIVEKMLPKLVSAVKNSPELSAKLNKEIENMIRIQVEKPLHELASAIGFDNIFEIRQGIAGAVKKYLAGDGFAEKFEKMTTGNKNLMDKTIGELLKINENDLTEIVKKKFLTKEKLNSAAPTIIDSFTGNFRINGIYDHIPKKSFLNIKNTITDEVKIILSKNLPPILRSIGLADIVEDKINNLDLYEVEDLLFSFMRDQFKWINILGFIIGFLFGVFQTATILLSN